MKGTLLFFMVFILASCGAVVGVDYDEEIDFSQYTTYNFYPDIDSGLSEFDNKRIIRFTDSLLQERGFVRSENPQLLINFYASEVLRESRNAIGIGVGGGGRNGGIGVSGGIPIGGRVINQQLTLDFIDAANDALVWQAVAEDELKEKTTPQQKDAYYWSLLTKILKKYPPKKK